MLIGMAGECTPMPTRGRQLLALYDFRTLSLDELDAASAHAADFRDCIHSQGVVSLLEMPHAFSFHLRAPLRALSILSISGITFYKRYTLRVQAPITA